MRPIRSPKAARTTSASASSSEESFKRVSIKVQTCKPMRGGVMRSQHSVAAMAMACLLAAGVLGGVLGAAPMANAETAGRSVKSGKIAGNKGGDGKRRFYRYPHYRSVKIYLPVGPTSIYYDYPYYYSRGYYPTHIGGYVYYIPRYAGPGWNRRQ